MKVAISVPPPFSSRVFVVGPRETPLSRLYEVPVFLPPFFRLTPPPIRGCFFLAVPLSLPFFSEERRRVVLPLVYATGLACGCPFLEGWCCVSKYNAGKLGFASITRRSFFSSLFLPTPPPSFTEFVDHRSFVGVLSGSLFRFSLASPFRFYLGKGWSGLFSPVVVPPSP